MQPLIVLQGDLLDDHCYHNTHDVCRYAMVSFEELFSMVDEGILEPEGSVPDEWIFSMRDFLRSRIVAQLQHDLGVNLAGAAIIINLLETQQHS